MATVKKSKKITEDLLLLGDDSPKTINVYFTKEWVYKAVTAPHSYFAQINNLPNDRFLILQTAAWVVSLRGMKNHVVRTLRGKEKAETLKKIDVKINQHISTIDKYFLNYGHS